MKPLAELKFKIPSCLSGLLCTGAPVHRVVWLIVSDFCLSWAELDVEMMDQGHNIHKIPWNPLQFPAEEEEFHPFGPPFWG